MRVNKLGKVAGAAVAEDPDERGGDEAHRDDVTSAARGGGRLRPLAAVEQDVRRDCM